ncbi:MAG: hypothetical protein QXF80_06290 [Thermoplasmatales archaeon]
MKLKSVNNSINYMPNCEKFFMNCDEIRKHRDMVRPVRVVFARGFETYLPYYVVETILTVDYFYVPLDPYAFTTWFNRLYYNNNEVIGGNHMDVALSMLGWKWGGDGNVYFIDDKIGTVVLGYMPTKMWKAIEVFNRREYDFFNVKGKDVVDIGASMGESTLFFLKTGALHVYAFEQNPIDFDILVQNVQKNTFDGEARLMNVTVGKKTADDIVTISEIVEMVEKPYLLKVDCGGCEKDVVADDKVYEFEKVIVKLHGVESKSVRERLEKKYKCFESPRNSDVIVCEKK